MEDNELDLYREEVLKSQELNEQLGIGIGLFQVFLIFMNLGVQSLISEKFSPQ